MHSDIGVSNVFLDMSTQARKARAKTNKCDCINLGFMGKEKSGWVTWTERSILRI